MYGRFHWAFSQEKRPWCMKVLLHINIYQVRNVRFCLDFLSEWCPLVYAAFSIVTQFPPPPPSARAVDKCLVSCGGGRHGEEVADASCRTERSTSGSVSAVLICHKCPPFPMAKDKGQRTYEEHAFLMWHSHQIHHSGLSRMPMTLYSSSNYSEATRQYECKPWRAHLPLTCRRPKQFSTSSPFEAWTCEPCVDSGVVFDWE